MRIAAFGDIHLRKKVPQYRTDDFAQTQWEKMMWAMRKSDREGCSINVFPGDVTDLIINPIFPYDLTQKYIRLFNAYGQENLVVFGQHDMRHRGGKENTPLWTMEAAHSVTLLDQHITRDGCNFYGANFGDPIPQPENGTEFNMLVAHMMVVEDEQLYPGQDDHTTGNILFRKFPDYNIIITGDNHQTFMHKSRRGNVLVNAGSLMRTTIGQRDHVPCFFIVDTHTMEVEKVTIPHLHIGLVMRLEEADEKKEQNEKLEAWIEHLGEEVEVEGLDFIKNLEVYCNENNLEEGVVKFIREATNVRLKHNNGGPSGTRQTNLGGEAPKGRVRRAVRNS